MFASGIGVGTILGLADIRFIVCNTTEAGIQYDPSCQFTDVLAASYPGKLTQWLYRRFQTFGQEKGKGVVILSCELIDNNGKELEKCVMQYADQWKLGESFKVWLKEENVFCSTLTLPEEEPKAFAASVTDRFNNLIKIVTL